jgi:LmbE family N-acetylglucosaminyl deacetylase
MKRAVDTIVNFRRLPIANLGTITNGRKVTVLAPHGDDESLGCGGLIAELAAIGRPPVVVIVTDGTGSHPPSVAYPAPRLRDLRENEALAAGTILVVPGDHLNFLQVRDTAIPTSGPESYSFVHRVERR